MKNCLPLLFMLLTSLTMTAKTTDINADITFCVDLSCLPSATAPSVYGAFNGWCANCNLLTDPENDGIWCTTISMPDGAQEYKFFVQEEGDEDLSPTENSACTVTNAGFTNRLITVTSGVAETVSFGWESCTSTCTPPPALAEPTSAAPNPDSPEEDVISLFSGIYNDVPVDTWRTVWSAGDLADIQIDGNDTKQYTNLNFVGIEMLGPNSIDASSMNTFHLDIWTPNMSVVRVKLVDFGADNAFGGGDDSEHEVLISNPNLEEWVSLDIPLSNFTNLASTQNISQLILSGVPVGAGALYVDNVYFSYTPPIEPMVAAPSPTASADEIISLFSNVYDDVPVDTWRTPWSFGPTALTDLQIQGDDAKLYDNLGFVGIEFVGANSIDATEMNTFHIDIWTPAMDEFKIKLVDFGADNAFGGGDDTEHEISLNNPTPETWVSYDIPLADFANLASTANLSQLILSSEPFGATRVWIDNVYFRNITQPFLECRQPVSTVNAEGLCGVDNLIVLDPFILDPSDVGGASLSSNMPDFFPIGTTIIDWTLTNTNGSTSECQSLVIIEDIDGPVVEACSTEVDYTGPNSCNATVVVDAVISDNCGIASITGTGTFTRSVGYYAHEIVATDVNGVVTVHTVDIYVHDTYEPTFNNCPTETITLSSSTFPVSMMPSASDNCGAVTMSNNIPAGGLPDGESTVTFTATDDYGNTSNCIVNVSAANQLIALHPAGDIGATTAENENSQVVTWNPVNAETQCSYCEETNLEGFTFIGNYFGHQYFLADDISITRESAQMLAETYDAHLAVISNEGENTFLKEALSNEARTAWIGLMPQDIDGEWSFVWDNEEANNFNALDLDLEAVTENTRIILTQDGTWVSATNEEEKYFLMERPCVNLTQTGPIAPNANNQMLRSGDAWPQGDYTVSYSAVDMCGNETELTFNVNVQPEISEYCTTTGTDNSIWIEGVTFHELTNNSTSNVGYADFSENITTMNIGDGVVLLDLKAGGTTTNEVMYWRVWLDKNNDGDFFDAGEILFEQSTANAHLQTNINLPQEAIYAARLRVAVARHAFPEPCGNPYIGEIEDYTVTLNVPVVIDIQKIPELAISPNPADTHVYLDLSDFAEKNVNIYLYDNLGRTVQFSKNIDTLKGNIRLDLENYPAGLYYISVTTDKHQVTKRLVLSGLTNVSAAAK